jgi:peptide/nickel transport system substrate-binding protein
MTQPRQETTRTLKHDDDEEVGRGAFRCGGRLALAGTARRRRPEKPQYGGTLNIGTVYPHRRRCRSTSGDWAWKHNQDTGLAYEQLFAADLQEPSATAASIPSRRRLAAPDALRGELAEKWEWKHNPLRVEISCARA